MKFEEDPERPSSNLSLCGSCHQEPPSLTTIFSSNPPMISRILLRSHARALPPVRGAAVTSSGFVLGAALIAGLTAATVCEEPIPEKEELEEETDCILCQTYRQGPCASVWRPLEACVKQPIKQGCDSLVAPFQECLKEHSSLYSLISLDVEQQRYVRSIEIDFFGEKRQPMEVVIDWTNWLAFCEDQGSLVQIQKEFESWSSLDRQVPLWKRFHMRGVEPSLVSVTAKIPRTKDGRALQAVYCLDQDDMSLGFQTPDDDTGDVKLSITMHPAMTKSLRVCALYAQDEEEVLYQSQRFSLESVAKNKSAVE